MPCPAKIAFVSRNVHDPFAPTGKITNIRSGDGVRLVHPGCPPVDLATGRISMNHDGTSCGFPHRCLTAFCRCRRDRQTTTRVVRWSRRIPMVLCVIVQHSPKHR
jgi:hypothetical protein